MEIFTKVDPVTRDIVIVALIIIGLALSRTFRSARYRVSCFANFTSATCILWAALVMWYLDLMQGFHALVGKWIISPTYAIGSLFVLYAGIQGGYVVAEMLIEGYWKTRRDIDTWNRNRERNKAQSTQ